MEGNDKSARRPRLSMDIEEGSHQQSTSYFDTPSRCFPIEICKCCPAGFKLFIPGTLQKIQDTTHLILVVGVVASTLLVCLAVFAIYRLECTDSLCIKELLALIFIVPCTVYSFRIIGQYDERLTTKQQEAKQQRDNLTNTYHNLLSDMDGLLSKSAESSAGLAERSFESKRRDFQRFLERMKSKYSSLYSGNKGDSDMLIQQIRRFCMNWLKVFEECSIDPVQYPKVVLTIEELNRCSSVSEIVDLCLDRLRVTEVRFISIQRDQDAQMLRRNRNEFARLTLALPSAAGPPTNSMWSNAPPTNSMQSFPPMSSVRSACGAVKRQGISWFAVGSGFGCGCSSTGQEAGFPKELNCVFVHLVVLSQEHLLLLIGFCVGWVILVMQSVSVLVGESEKSTLAKNLLLMFMIIVAQFCLFTMILKFEELDMVQQLEREVSALAQQNEQVAKQRENMREFWTNAQQLTELWLYRTVPRLDLYKEVHCLLEDAEGDLLPQLSGCNEQLECLESHLSAIQAWRGDGDLKIEDKKRFGKEVNYVCQEQELDSMLVKLEEISASGMRCLMPALPTNSVPALPTNSMRGAVVAS